MLTFIIIVSLSGFLSAFLDAIMDNGHILSGYYKWLVKNSGIEIDEKDGTISFSKWYFKPLGGCVTCMNTWITFIFYVIGIIYFEHITFVAILFYPLAAGLSFVTLNLATWLVSPK